MPARRLPRPPLRARRRCPRAERERAGRRQPAEPTPCLTLLIRAAEEDPEMKQSLLTLLVGLVAFGLAALPAAAGGNGAQSTTIHVSGSDDPFELGGCGLPDT